MKDFLNRHKALKITLTTIGLVLLVLLASYGLNSLLFKGASLDWQVGLIKLGLGTLFIGGGIAELVYLCKGIGEKVKTHKANQRANDMLDRVQSGLEYIKDSKGKNTKVTDLLAEQARLEKEVNNQKAEVTAERAKGKATGESIVNLLNTNIVLNNILSKNVALQQTNNELAALTAKYKAGTATQSEVEDMFVKMDKFLNQQINDNKNIQKTTDDIINAAINLTR